MEFGGKSINSFGSVALKGLLHLHNGSASEWEQHLERHLLIGISGGISDKASYHIMYRISIEAVRKR